MLLATDPRAPARSMNRTSFDQSYLVTRNNWAFRNRFVARRSSVERLRLRTRGALSNVDRALGRRRAARRTRSSISSRVTYCVDPPSVPLDEAAVGPAYATLAPELVAIFDWAHMLHRQLYDTWAAVGLTDAQRDAEVARLHRLL